MITTAGILVTILFGLSAVVTSQKGFVVEHGPRLLLIGAVAAFFVAALGGMAANLPLRRTYREVDVEDLTRLADDEDLWEAPIGPASRRAAQAQVGILTWARKGNNFKAWAVIGALISEVLGVAFAATSVGWILG